MGRINNADLLDTGDIAASGLDVEQLAIVGGRDEGVEQSRVGSLDLQDFVGRAVLSLGSQNDFVVLDGVSVGLELCIVGGTNNVGEALRLSSVGIANQVDNGSIAIHADDSVNRRLIVLVGVLCEVLHPSDGGVDISAVNLILGAEQELGRVVDLHGSSRANSSSRNNQQAAGDHRLSASVVRAHLNEVDRAVGKGLDAEQVAVDDVLSGRVSLLVLRGVVGDGERAARSSANVHQLNVVSASNGLLRLCTNITQRDAVDSDNIVGTVDILHIRIGLARAERGEVTSVADGGDDTVSIGRFDLGDTDQVAIEILEPRHLGDLLSVLVQMELQSIVISSAVDGVLASVVPDDSLSAFEGLRLASDLSIRSSLCGGDDRAGTSHGSASGVSVDEDIIALDIGVVGGAVLQNDSRIAGGAVIDGQLDLGRGLQMAGSVEGSSGDLLNLGEEGVDHDDTVLIDLGQTALRAEFGNGVGSLNIVLHRGLAVDEDRVDLFGLEADVVRDVALGDSGVVGLDELVGVNILTDGGSALVPSVGRTAPLVLSFGQGQVEVSSEELVLVVVDSAVRGDVHSVGSGVGGHPVAGLGVPGEVGDGLAIDNLLSLEGVEHDLGSLVTGQGGVGVEVVETLHQALNLGKLEGVDSPRGADETFFVLVVAEDDEDHLQELGALDVRLGNEGGGILTSDDARAVAVGNIALAPAALHVSEGVRGGVEAGDVGGLVGKDRNDLGRLFTGDVLGRLEALVSRIAFQNVDVGKNVDSFNVLYVLRISEVRGLCAGDGREAEKGRDGENQSKNLFEVLHNEFLLFYFTGRKRPVMMDSS